MSKTRNVLLLLLGLAALTKPLRGLLAAILPDASVNPVPGCIAGMLLALLTLALPAWLLRPWRSERLPRQKAVLPGLGMAAAAALLTRAAMTPVDAAWQRALGLTPNVIPVPESIPMAMLYIAALAIVPALAEESFFRGALLTGLLDGSRRITATALTTLAFVLLHGSLASLPSLLTLSVLLTLLMLGTGHVAVPLTAHLLYNLTALNWVQLPGWGSILCGAGLIGLSAWLCLRQPRIAHPPMKKADAGLAALALAVLMLSYMI